MIKFDGYLTGTANKYLINKILKRGNILFFLCFGFTIPIWAFLAIRVGGFIEVMSVLFGYMLLFPLFFRLIITKKEKQNNNLKKVFINEDIITSVSDSSIISNRITDVKEVQDYGEFYYIVFPCRFITSIFVCQKELLSSGTIEDFEALFEGKIMRKKNRLDKRGKTGDGSMSRFQKS